MNGNKQEKSENVVFFKKKDLLVYSFIVLSVAVLFLAVFFSNKDKGTKGFTVFIGNDTVITLEYRTGEYTVAYEYKDDVKVDTSAQTVTVYFNAEKTDYNVIVYDCENKNVRITESTCSQRKDCITFDAISGSGFIYCAPHDLKILPLEGENFISPTVG